MLSLSPAKWTRIIVLIAAGLLLLAAACGGDDDDGGNGDNGGGDATPTSAPADDIESQPDVPQEVDDEVTEAVGGELQIEARDVPTFEFAPNNLKVPLNETTTIEIANLGAAIHNFRIAGADGEWNSDDDVATDFITGGDTASVEFSPTLAGTYTFRCDIHPDVQGGVIIAG